MSKKPKISIAVLNWNGKRFIDPFMESFQKLDYPKEKLELLFIDNFSSDDSLEYLQSNYGKLKQLKIIKNKQNYGYAGGNNKGIHHATGDYVLVCNNDLELDPKSVSELVDVAQSKKAAAVVPLLLFKNKTGIINNAGSILEPNSDWPIKEIGINEKNKGQYDQVEEITAFCGACVLFSRAFLKNVGLFDQRFFMYFEDGDLSWRGQEAGLHYYRAPKAKAFHYHTGSSKEGSPLFNHFVGRNRLLIVTKHASFTVIAKAWVKTLRDHLLLRLKHIYLSLFKKYSRRQALREFWLSQKMLWAAAFMTPYALLKRWHILKEDTL